MDACLNCGAALTGRFCAACGQRDIPPHPTVSELAGDAWHELSGYDGRIASTVRGLFKPGLLTRGYIEGQRARYLSPIRLYLIVSVIYFVVAAAAPQLESNGQRSLSPGVRVAVTGSDSSRVVTEEERRELLASAERAPWILRPTLRAIAEGPDQFRARLFTTMPRVFFALLPVFAGIVALFYRRETFPTSLVFSAHIHAFAFVALTISEAVKFTGSAAAAMVAGAASTLVIGVYAFMACRRVFNGGRAATLAKMTGIGFLYLLASIPAFFIILMWAAIS
jgi:hypothetical protein